jgi:hypothetical protein
VTQDSLREKQLPTRLVRCYPSLVTQNRTRRECFSAAAAFLVVASDRISAAREETTENGASGNLIPRLKGRNHDFESCQLSDVCLSSKVGVNCAAAPMIARYLPIVDDLLLVALRESASNSSKEFASRAAAAYSAGWISIAEVRRKVRGGLLYYGDLPSPTQVLPIPTPYREMECAIIPAQILLQHAPICSRPQSSGCDKSVEHRRNRS